MPSGIKTKRTGTSFIVRCPDYDTDPYPTVEAAAKCVAATTRMGACPHSHEIVEVFKLDSGEWVEVR